MADVQLTPDECNFIANALRTAAVAFEDGRRACEKDGAPRVAAQLAQQKERAERLADYIEQEA